MSRLLTRLARHRMAETGEKYTTARRAVLAAGPAEWARLAEADRAARDRARYPFTPRDGLDSRHVLSGWETARRRH